MGAQYYHGVSQFTCHKGLLLTSFRCEDRSLLNGVTCSKPYGHGQWSRQDSSSMTSQPAWLANGSQQTTADEGKHLASGTQTEMTKLEETQKELLMCPWSTNISCTSTGNNGVLKHFPALNKYTEAKQAENQGEFTSQQAYWKQMWAFSRGLMCLDTKQESGGNMRGSNDSLRGAFLVLGTTSPAIYVFHPIFRACRRSKGNGQEDCCCGNH